MDERQVRRYIRDMFMFTDTNTNTITNGHTNKHGWIHTRGDGEETLGLDTMGESLLHNGGRATHVLHMQTSIVVNEQNV